MKVVRTLFETLAFALGIQLFGVEFAYGVLVCIAIFFIDTVLTP